MTKKYAKQIIIFQSVLIVALVAVFVVPRVTAYIEFISSPIAEDEFINSHFYDLSISDLAPKLELPWVSGTQDGMVLAMSADKEFENEDDTLLGASNPNHQIYLIDPSASTNRKVAEVNFLDSAFGEGQWPEDTKHRTLDFVASPVENEGSSDVFISFSSASEQSGCRYLHVLRLQFSNPSYSSEGLTEHEFFRSECFPKSTLGDFHLHQSGGRIAFDPEKISEGDRISEIYLSVGDFVVLRENSSSLSEASRAQLTSVLRIDERGWEVVADGFRNPQGLAFANLSGLGQVLVESEHGPRGGDELNLVEAGKNFDWPTYSYGTAYEPQDANNKPVNEGAAASSRPPWYSWVPSIAPSQIRQVSGPEFSKWWAVESKEGQLGDLLVSTLRDQSLIRLRVEEGYVRYSEQIKIGERIRSLSSLPTGEILLGTDSGKVLMLEAESEWVSSEGLFQKVSR